MCNALQQVFEGLLVSFVKWSANSITHSLAKYASQLDNQLVWLEESPRLALKALYFDSRCFNEWMMFGLF